MGVEREKERWAGGESQVVVNIYNEQTQACFPIGCISPVKARITKL